MSPMRSRVQSHEIVRLDQGWSVAVTMPDEVTAPGDLDRVAWLPAHVPGTAAGALRDAGVATTIDFDTQDWWFRTRFDGAAAAPGEEVVLRFDGLATVADVWLNGELIVRGESMFASYEVVVGDRLRGDNELAIRCRALTPQLAVRRVPRARWRTRLVADGNLRWFRTMVLGRAPGFAPGPAAVGPWRPVWLERRRDIVVEDLVLEPRVDGDEGVLAVSATIRPLGGQAVQRVELEVESTSGIRRATLAASTTVGRSQVRGELRIVGADRWWPHTHGEPVLHDVRLLVTSAAGTHIVDAGRVGFRALAAGERTNHDVERDGLDLHINGRRIFARGAVWTPVDAIGMAPSRSDLRTALQTARDAGMNMLRVPGTTAYEQDDFHELCDELGILVWQDFMYANLDYPFADEGFRRRAEDEAREIIGRLAGRPSLVVLCGNSEVEQQVAMLGLDPMAGRDEFYGATIPALARASGMDAIYIPSAPYGGDLPFRTDRGVANYYGVGGYRRPLADARTAGVRFAAECLAFANVPDDAVIDELWSGGSSGVAVHHPRWKAGVPRDAGSGWDFDDVRDHYMRTLFDLDPGELRRIDHGRYLELSRAVSGEVMAEVFGEWRRTASPCGGGLVLWLRDLVPGAGWGVVDHHGRPKVAYHHLRRALAPIAAWTTDEGLGGIVAHVANDGPVPLAARLRVALYQDLELRVGEGQEALEIPAHGAHQRNVETLIGHFVDASWAYRFGPPAQDAIVVSLERDGTDGVEVLSQSFRFPAGRPLISQSAVRLGLEGRAPQPGSDGIVHLVVSSRRLAYGVRIDVPGFVPSDDSFSVEPGGTRAITLRPELAGASFHGGGLTALNLSGRVGIVASGETA